MRNPLFNGKEKNLTKHDIIHGDTTKTIKGLESGSVDLIVTDPPYLVGYRDRVGRTLANDDNREGVLPVFPNLYRVLKPGGYCVLFCGWSSIAAFSGAWEAAGFRTCGHIVWPKPYVSSARHLQHCHESAWLLSKGKGNKPIKPIVDIQKWVYSGNRSHPTEKAVEIITPLIRAFSKPGDLVLDPFLGSGTTVIAAALTGRRAIGIELEERYCALARKRLAGMLRFQIAQSSELSDRRAA